MSHNVLVNMIADQEIDICNRRVNIHNISAIIVDANGKIIDVYLEPEFTERYRGWLSGKRTEEAT